MGTLSWRWFPAGMIAAMGLVFAVNGYMVYDALHTFPGEAGQDGFDLSNAYNRVIATAREQAGLGWRIEASVAPSHVPVLRLTGRTGTPLPVTEIDAQAERPLGSAETTVLAFHPAGDGQFLSGTALPAGQWDIMLTVHAGGQRYDATRRVIVR